MWFTAIKTAITVALVLTLTWLSKTKPTFSGFLVVLPTVSLLVVIFSHIEQGNNFDVREFAKGMFIGLPGLLGFYLPFFFINNFYLSMCCGFLAIIALFFTYRHFNLI